MTLVILAGGKSSRMGRDKSFIPFGNKALIEVIIEKFRYFFEDMVIISNKPALHHKYGLKVYEDIFKDKGPLGGIHSGLSHSKSLYNFFTACDTPFININLVNYMIGKMSGFSAVVPMFGGKTHPLFAIYSRDAIKEAEARILGNKLKMSDFVDSLNTRIINEEEVSVIDKRGRSFSNINTKEDYKWALNETTV